MRRPDQAPADPYHVAAAFIANNVVCECGQPAAYKGRFINYSGGGKPIENAMLLCEDCAQMVDEDVDLQPLQARPAWEHI
jgi:hypothetical protein